MSTLCARGADRAEGSAGVTSEVTEALLRNAVDERGEECQDAVDEAPRILIVIGLRGEIESERNRVRRDRSARGGDGAARSRAPSRIQRPRIERD